MLQKCIVISPNFTLGYVELVKLKLMNESNISDLLKIIVRQSTEAEYAIMYAEYLNKKGS